MKGLMAVYLIFLLILPGCMMLPMALLPLLTDTLQPQSQPQPQPQPRQESTGSQAPVQGQSQASAQGQSVEQQNLGRR